MATTSRLFSFQRLTLGGLAASVGTLVVLVAADPPRPGTGLSERPAKWSATIERRQDPAATPAKTRGDEAETAATAQTKSTRNSPTVQAVSQTFDRLGYTLGKVLEGSGQVPRLFLASLPADLKQVGEVKRRKAVFFQTVLPIVLRVNEEILADRARLWKLYYRKKMSQRIDAVDRLWLTGMAERYRTARDDIDALLKRVDIIPPSLALAQAAEESGWGTSRFAQEGNALFGQWTFGDQSKGLVPKDRDTGADHKIKAFDSLKDAVRGYVLNLNTHRAYKELRERRWSLRKRGEPLAGRVLAQTLTRYSERGAEYVQSLQTIIEVNELEALDAARLDGDVVSLKS